MERVVLSNKYLQELRNLPEIQLSSRKAMNERHLGEYTSLDVILQSHLHSNVCRVQLTQNLGMYRLEISMNSIRNCICNFTVAIQCYLSLKNNNVRREKEISMSSKPRLSPTKRTVKKVVFYSDSLDKLLIGLKMFVYVCFCRADLFV